VSDSASRRLRAERERLDMSQRALAELGGVSKNTHLAYENGTSPIPLDYLERLEAHGLDLSYVATGFRNAGGMAVRIDDDDQVEIASVDLVYGFGGTFLDIGETAVEKVPFSRSWLRANVTEAPPEVLGVAQGIGDSMEPVLFDRDLVFFDRSARLNEHVSDKMWVFAYGQIGMIKRLRPLPDGKVKIMSANRTYPDEIAANDGELHIIGRVVASLRRH
jgi:phage repressor protein C with HTH and peptisase S24 domain